MDSNSRLIKLASEGNLEELQLLLKFETFNQVVLNKALSEAVIKSRSTSDHL
jgi:hypothetical protein